MENSKLSDAGKALETSNEAIALTSGVSMRPMLREHRDMVVIKRVDRELKKGDVVLYPGKDGRFILHRIITIKNNSLIVRGDNNYFTERGIKPDDILGILKEFYRDGKYINCATDKKYRIYTFYILHSYGLRYLWKRIIRPTLGKIKRFIFSKK